MNRSTMPAFAAVLAASGLAAAQASAATIAFDRTCVNSSNDFGVIGTGFTPGSNVKVQPRNGIFKRFAVDAAGNFAGAMRASIVDITDPRRLQPVDVLASDDSTGQPLAAATIFTTYPRFFLLPRVIDARRRMTVSIRGLQPGLPAYAHVRLRSTWVRTVRLGAPQAPCGTLKVKSPLLRGLRLRSTTAQVYVQVDQSPTPNIIRKPAGYAHLLLRQPVGYAFFRYRAQVFDVGFRDGAVGPTPAAAGAARH